MNQEVLVLNSDYEPLNVCNMRRAMVLMFLGKADMLHEGHILMHSASNSYPVPSVLRLKTHVKRPAPQLKLTRRSIFARDNYTCQYCGQRGGDLTVDHVIPRGLGGKNTWDNLVCCCRACNGKKGSKTLSQLGLALRTQPRKPKYVPFISLTKFITATHDEVWRDYLPAFYSYQRDPVEETSPIVAAAG